MEVKKTMKRTKSFGLRKIAAISAAIAVISANASVTAFAAGTKSSSWDFITEAVKNDTGYNESHNYVVENPKVDTTALPSKFDLRDVDGINYVPEVKFQNPFGTCWSFGATAAAEISIAHEFGADFNTMTDEQKASFDFSEHHLAWFAYEPIHEDDPLYPSQAGEGIHRVYSSDHLTLQEQAIERFNSGGMYYQTLPLYASGVGPVSESLVPYSNKEDTNTAMLSTFEIKTEEDFEALKAGTADKTQLKYRVIYNKENVPVAEYKSKLEDTKKVAKNFADGWQGTGKYYSTSYFPTDSGDWTVDYSKKYSYAMQIDNASQLPDPATTGENGEYVYNEKATDAIKRELNAGRAVAVAYYADQSQPGQKATDGSYINFLTKDGKPASNAEEAAIWAQYTYDKEYDPTDPESVNKMGRATHAVCVVGYDDDFPKEYFNDPNGTIGGNGAFIIRNSWGSKDNSVDSSRYAWGNDGDGYAYISYYDQSLICPQSYDFRTPADGTIENADGIYNHMYDHLGAPLSEITTDKDIYMANEFTEEGDTVLTDIGVNTTTPNATVNYEIYFLNAKSKNPTDGTRVTSGTKTFDYAGFHCVRLDKEIAIPEGQKYSVVAKIVREDGKTSLPISYGFNETYYNNTIEEKRAEYIKEYGDDLGFKPGDYVSQYSKAVINEGESFIGSKSGKTTEWADWKNVAEEASASVGNVLDFDNMPIRAYVKGNVLDVRNTVDNEKEYYQAGDVIEGTITIKNDVSSDSTYTIENIKLEDSLGCISEEDANIASLKANESKTIKYKYTVTEEDVKAGSITSTVNITVNGEPYSFVKELAKNSFTVLTAAAPGKPTNIKVDKNGKVTWNAAENAESYRVAKIVNGTTYYSGEVTDTSYTFNKLPASDYQVYVIAYGKGNLINKSAKTTVKDDKPLNYVNSVTIDDNGKVTWEAANNAVAYKVGKVVNGKVYYGAKTTDTSYTFKSVPTQDYQVFVVAFSADDRTAWGKKNLVEVGSLGTVIDPKVDANGNVSWTAARNAVKYKVGKTVNGKTYYTGELTTNSTTIKVPKSDYKVFVVAFDKDGNKTWGTKADVKVK